VYWLPEILSRLLHTFIYTHHWELMKSVGSSGSLVTAAPDERVMV
jgi:hypothetical protein